MPNLKKKKIDNLNNINSKYLQTIFGRKAANDFSSREKVVGIKIGTKSKEYQDQIYYYKTTVNLKVGDKINVIMNTGGTPDCVVVSVDRIENAKYKSLKELKLG